MFKRIQNIHFVGIGGIGMSGIAEVLLNLKYQVSGSDLKRSKVTTQLKKNGAKVFYGHKSANVDQAHVVVVSSAVKSDNPEVIAAISRSIPVIPRAEMLAELMRLKYSIAIAGSHGKTTTTSLVGSILQEVGLDPTLVIGGVLKKIRSNARLGKGEFLVAEADESDGSFVRLTPTIAVMTNIDPEHLDHYLDFEELKSTFAHFANKVPFYGSVVVCSDHPVIANMLPQLERKVLSYGIEKNADLMAKQIKIKGLGQDFKVYFKGSCIGDVHLNLMGRHNVLNALAAIGVALELELPFKKIAKALKEFKGIQRRMDLLHQSEELYIIDDYAHHPIEIKATLETLRQVFPKKRIVAAFQPHRFSRTRDLFDDFVDCFDHIDDLLLTDIYAAGEKEIIGVSSENLFRQVKAKVDFNCEYVPGLKELKTRLIEMAQVSDSVSDLDSDKSADIIVTLGAGNIQEVGQAVAKQFKKKS